MYTIKQASALTGIPADTIRAWERRYQLPPPARSEGGYRLYDDQALRTYRTMRLLVSAGWTPRNAATAAIAGPDQRPPVPTPTEFVARVAEGSLSGQGIDAELTALFAGGELQLLLDGWMLPMLDDLGAAWAEGRVTVAHEHEVSAAVMRRLAVAFEERPQSAPPRILLGLPAGCRHEVVLLAFAVLLRDLGAAVTYLGADLPLESWLDAVRRLTPEVVVTAAHSGADVDGIRALGAELAHLPNPPRVLVGGRRQGDVPAPGQALGHCLGEAARRLVEDLGAPSSSPPSADR